MKPIGGEGRSVALTPIVVLLLLFTSVINLLGLTAPFFMLEIYDRVIPSGSLQTLTALLVLAGALYFFAGLIDIIRNRALTRLAGIADHRVSDDAFAVASRAPLSASRPRDALAAIGDADNIRTFLTGPGPAALFDLPWAPFYLAVCFVLHPLVGWLAVASAALLIALALVSGWGTQRQAGRIAEAVSRRNKLGEAFIANAEVIEAMGMQDRTRERWRASNERFSDLLRLTGDFSGLCGSVAKTVRQAVQSATLALGAWLVIQGDMTGGAIVAASVVVARALAPIEQMIGTWRTAAAAAQSWRRLTAAVSALPRSSAVTELPAPSRSFSLEAVSAAPPGSSRMTIRDVNIQLGAGTVLGVIGPSASGKSSLVRAIAGVWPLVRGSIRFDGATPDQWSPSERGRLVGYMPQSSSLLPGTIAANIARLDRAASSEAVVAAARAAGVHEMIVKFPNGYDTVVGEGGFELSAGQCQRIALARALFGDPFLVVLDEPNSNLDTEGDLALNRAIEGVRRRGGIVVVVTHRNAVLAILDLLLVVEAGSVKGFGPREPILKALQKQSSMGEGARPGGANLTVVGADQGQ